MSELNNLSFSNSLLQKRQWDEMEGIKEGEYGW
jgi:hypothetical protein